MPANIARTLPQHAKRNSAVSPAGHWTRNALILAETGSLPFSYGRPARGHCFSPVKVLSGPVGLDLVSHDMLLLSTDQVDSLDEPTLMLCL